MSTFSCREGNGFMRGADASRTGGEGLPATMLCVSSVGIDQCPGAAISCLCLSSEHRQQQRNNQYRRSYP